MEVVEPQRRCDLCRLSSPDAISARVAPITLCADCAVLVGEVALTGGDDWLPTVWKPARMLGPKPESGSDPLTADELETHADLAVAYAEMGLLSDAMEEAALVLSKRTVGQAAVLALDVLLGDRLAHAGALDHLRKQLFGKN